MFGELRLRGANVTSVFKSHKLFGIFFWKNFSVLIRLLVSISVNVCRCCGCKSTTFIDFCKLFSKLFLIFFISHWYDGYYKAKFFCLLLGFGWICLFCAGFATKAPGRKVFLYWLCPLFKKAQSWVFLCFSWFLWWLRLFFPEHDHLLLKTTPLAPIVVEILLCRGSA